MPNITGRGGKRFSADYQPNRAPRGFGWRRIILEELEREGYSENDFVRAVILRAFNPEDKASTAALCELIARLAPMKKAQFETVEFKFDNSQTPSEKIDSVLQEVAAGGIAPDVAAVIVDMIKSSVEIKEATELADRMERIEEMLAAQDA